MGKDGDKVGSLVHKALLFSPLNLPIIIATQICKIVNERRYSWKETHGSGKGKSILGQ